MKESHKKGHQMADRRRLINLIQIDESVQIHISKRRNSRDFGILSNFHEFLYFHASMSLGIRLSLHAFEQNHETHFICWSFVYPVSDKIIISNLILNIWPSVNDEFNYFRMKSRLKNYVANFLALIFSIFRLLISSGNGPKIKIYFKTQQRQYA